MTFINKKMGLFRKKKEVKELKLPEAPSAFPELPSEKHEESGLPPLPNLPALKPIGTLPQLEPVERIVPKMVELHRPAMPKATIPQMQVLNIKEPIFIKIDKFKEAMANFELVKKRLNETTELLEKIKETRAKEEEELNDWAEELGLIKQKISSIDKKIFSNLE